MIPSQRLSSRSVGHADAVGETGNGTGSLRPTLDSETAMTEKAWKRMTNKEKLESLKEEIAGSATSLDQINRRLADISRVSKDNAVRTAQMISDLHLRLSAVAANVLALSAIVTNGSETRKKSEKKARLWSDHDIQIKM